MLCFWCWFGCVGGVCALLLLLPRFVRCLLVWWPAAVGEVEGGKGKETPCGCLWW